MSLELEVWATLLVHAHYFGMTMLVVIRRIKGTSFLCSYLRGRPSFREEWIKRRSNEALAQRPPVPVRKASKTLDWQRVQGRFFSSGWVTA